MTKAEWIAANLAGAPPLSPAQVAILRPVFRPVVPRNADAAPARQQEPHVPVVMNPQKEAINDPF